jgi:hypothetical protein
LPHLVVGVRDLAVEIAVRAAGVGDGAATRVAPYDIVDRVDDAVVVVIAGQPDFARELNRDRVEVHTERPSIGALWLKRNHTLV